MRYGQARQGVARYGKAWPGTARFGKARQVMGCQQRIASRAVLSSVDRHFGTVDLGLTGSGLVRRGLAWAYRCLKHRVRCLGMR